MDRTERQLRQELADAWALVDRYKAATERLAGERDALIAAIDNEMVTAHIGTFSAGDDPRKALHEIICWHVQVALDPAVSPEAQRLIKLGESRAREQLGL